MSWLGARTPEGAASLLGFADLHPISIIDFTGEPVAIRFDHAWVEASFTDSVGTHTFPLDAAWKFKDRQPGASDLLTLVPFDEAGYLSQTRTESTHEFYEDQVRTYLAANQPGVSLADVAFDGPIHPQQVESLPTDLPYVVVGSPEFFDAVPATMQHRVQLRLTGGAGTQFNVTYALSDVALQTLEVGWNDLGAQVVPQLLVGGVVAATGSALAERSGVTLTIAHLEPGDDFVDRTFSYQRTAGQWLGIGLDAGQFTDAGILELQAAVNAAAINDINGSPFNPARQIGGLLSLAVQKWFHQTDQGAERIAALTDAQPIYNFVASGITTGEPIVDYFADLQNPFVPRGLNIDIANNFSQLVALDGSNTGDAARGVLTGFNDSAAEHEIWEELVNTASISTIKSLQLAGERGIPVFTITSANAGVLLPQLTHNFFTESAIADEVFSGATVTVPRDPTPLNDWQGVGYITRRPDGGEGFIISGGLNSAGEPATLGSYQGGSGSGDPNGVLVFDPDTGEWVQSYAGDPVNIANGNVKHDETDLLLPNLGVKLTFSRHYDSRNESDVGMGAGWSFSYSDRLDFPADGSVVWLDSTGNHLRFLPSGSGGFITPDSLYGTFTAIAGGFRWRDKTGLDREWNAAGQLTQTRDRYGNGVQVVHDGLGQLATVSDLVTPARSLSFTYAGGRLASVADFTGRTYTYSYVAGRLARSLRRPMPIRPRPSSATTTTRTLPGPACCTRSCSPTAASRRTTITPTAAASASRTPRISATPFRSTCSRTRRPSSTSGASRPRSRITIRPIWSGPCTPIGRRSRSSGRTACGPR